MEAGDVPNCLKTQDMCDNVVRDDAFSLEIVSQRQLKLWYDNDDWYDDDEIIEWYDGYIKRKAQKAKIKEEFLPIAHYPDRVMEWCTSEDEKGWWK